ncbi:50S ribosomal protein L2 [Candidatus Pacearchaeota archaeon]|nr:50S ribosomal protein L2 [Candidatus Pacearchaeota archaeon]
MGKRIIQQARGHGSKTYRVRRKAFRFKIKYPPILTGEGTVLKLFNSPGHSAPLAKVKYDKGIFYMPAFRGMIEGQKISFGDKELKEGNITELKNIPIKTQIYNIESRPRDGGVFIRSAGNSAVIKRISEEGVFVTMPSKKDKKFHPKCRATIGEIAGSGRQEKPIVRAGKKHHIKKAKNKLWPRTSAVKVNVIDHPFGSGRGKNPKSKIAKRNAPPGKKVGLLRPRRTGRRKK